MPTPKRDSQGLYRALGLEPEATEEQIQLAYEMLCEQPPGQLGATRSEIERAYSVLINPASRRAYDRLGALPRKARRRWIKLDDWRLLAACVALLVAILCFVWLPLYGSRFRSFSAGDQLVDLRGKSFGTVVQSEERHAFPGGESAPAYLIELSSTRDMRWFPAIDLQATCRRAP